MNPRQRRGVLFLLLAGLGALAVFFMVARYVGSVNSQVAPLVTVYQAARDVPAYRELSATAVVEVQMPERYVPAQALRDVDDLTGRRIGFNIAEGTLISADMLLPPSDLNLNEREIAIEVDAVTGIAGRVASGDFVDIYAVFADPDGQGGTSQVLVQNVRVVSVGGQQTRSKETAEGALREAEVLPVTVALEPDDALKVTYADAFATAVRLVGLPPGIQTEDRTAELGSVDDRALALPRRRDP